MPYKPPRARNNFKYHGDILSRVNQSVLDVSNIYKQVHQENLDPAWRTNESPYLNDIGTMRRASSFEQVQRRKIPRIKLPPISNSDLEKMDKRSKRTVNRFAQAYADKGNLYRSLLSTSLPDLPSLTKPQGQPYKYEKLSYTKRIQEGVQPPPPSNNQHAVAPEKPYRLPALHHQNSQGSKSPSKSPSKRKSSRRSNEKHGSDTDVFQIINTINRTVEYYEHDGHVYISDNNQSWKDDCPCQLCDRNKKEYFDSKKKIEERRLRRMKNSMVMREQHTSPVKELKED